MTGGSLKSDFQRQVEASPQASDFAKESGAKVTYNPDGSWLATVKGDENIKRAVEMQNGARAVEVERGQKLAASRPTESVVDKQGRTHAFPAHLIERVADKRGWKPKAYYGRPSEVYVVRDGELVRVR